ncbi:MAG: signal peptidase I [Prevotella sp.]|nr:signal peptidase I [Prevotella sp.]
MVNALKFIVATLIAILLMMVIRTYAFTLYTVPDDGLQPRFHKGQRVLVNKLSSATFNVGDYVVFNQEEQSGACLGEILSIPGDTIQIKGESYQIPTHCNAKHDCKACKIYLVEANGDKMLVARGDFVGKAVTK